MRDLQNPVEVPQKQFFVVVDVPVTMQRRLVSRTVKAPQIQFIAGVGGHVSSQQRRLASAGYGGDEGFFGLC